MAEETFVDPIAEQLYRKGVAELETAQSADVILRKAAACEISDDRSGIMQSAFYYLAAAQFLASKDAAKAAQAYHSAGQQLHRLQQLSQAGRAFSNAGKIAEDAARAMPQGPDQHRLQHLAVRAYSRANHSFAEAGELDASETEYLNERHARVAWAHMQGKHPFALLTWKATSNFGTSIPRWGAWIAGTLLVFSMSYELFFRLHWLEPMGGVTPSDWVPLWSAFYYAINVTSSLALVEYQPTHPLCQAVVMLNVIAGYLFLGIGIGIVGRIFKAH